MTDTIVPIPEPVQPAPDMGAAILAGVEQAALAAAPTAVVVAAATNPCAAIAVKTAADVVTAVTALEPFLAAAMQAHQSGVLTQGQLDQLTAQTASNVAAAHTAWLTAVAGHPGV